jgi:hypothetical protein
MKFRKYLIPVALLFSVLFFSGFTKVQAQNPVQVGIVLPYSGNYNHWNIRFYDWTGLVYEFDTDDNTFNTQVLGMIVPGTYKVEFSNNYNYGGLFDYGIIGPTYAHFRGSYDYYQWYGAVIEEGTYIQIDRE